MEKNVQLFKLMTSEEVLCELVNETADTFEVKKPFGVAPNPNGGGIMTFPWSLAALDVRSENVYTIMKHAVVMHHVPPRQLVDNYIEQTTGLAIPSQEDKSLILG